MMFKRVIGIFLLMIFGLQLMGHAALAVRFELHHDCQQEKSDEQHKPCCTGECQLSKDLKQQQNDDDPVKKSEKQPELVNNNNFDLRGVSRTPVVHLTNISTPELPASPHADVFHPPLD